MKIFLHIGTRKGSKGIKNKNLLILKKKKLIEHTLKFAKSLNFKKKIVINSDDVKVLNISKKYKVDYIIKRPKTLSSSRASKFSAWKYACQYLIDKNQINLKKDIFLDLDNTCPLRKTRDIEKMLKIYRNKFYTDNRIDCFFTITQARRNPYFQLMEFKKGFLKISKKVRGQKFIRRQDIPKVYEHCGVAYFLKPKFLLKKNNFLEGNLKGFEIDRISAMDIDDKDDVEIIKKYF